MKKLIVWSVCFVLGSGMMGCKQNTTGATKENSFVNSLGMRFVSVPGTKVLFSIWDTRVQDYRAYAEATPGVDARWKRRDLGLHPGDDYPVVMVSWNDAKAFCAWLTQKERKEGKIGQDQEYRLPTDKEWSVAVGPGKYPWGDQGPPPKGAGNYGATDFGSTSPVGSFKANQYGLYDMGGNVVQWCEDWYRSDMNDTTLWDKYPAIKNDGEEEKYRVLRGVDWSNSDNIDVMLSSFRHFGAPDDRVMNYGFRCGPVPGSSR